MWFRENISYRGFIYFVFCVLRFLHHPPMCFTLTHLYHAMANLSAKVQEKNQCANVLDLFYAQKVQFFLPITAGKGRKAICTEEKAPDIGNIKKGKSFCGFPFCGERGIRTPETLLTFTRFPGVPLQPLEHLSLAC